MAWHYLVALGSNMRHPHYGAPEKVIIAALAGIGLTVVAQSPIMRSAAIGPSRRRYANAAMVLTSHLDPPALLAHLQRIEARFGRVRRGTRWRARVLDLDIIGWSGGLWVSKGLVIPHTQFRLRSFVLTPAVTIAAEWKDPISRLSVRQLKARLDRRRPRH